MRIDAVARRQRILAATENLLKTHHNTEVSIERVAESANVGVATVYRNFTDKHKLFMETSLYVLHKVHDRLTRSLDDFHKNPADAFSSAVSDLIDGQIGALAVALAPKDLSSLPAPVMALRNHVRHTCDLLVRRAQEEGIIDPSLSAGEFLAGIMVISRPPIPGILTLDANVTEHLKQRYITALMSTSSS